MSIFVLQSIQQIFLGVSPAKNERFDVIADNLYYISESKNRAYLRAFHKETDKEKQQELFGQTIILFYHKYHFQIFYLSYST